MSDVGVVVIGRNEGERLKRCLRSLTAQATCIVYVDSGSTDGSAAFARSQDVHVIELDMSRPFTMARGRNTGFAHLLTLLPSVQYVQFVDGDCEVEANWIATARAFLHEHHDVAAVSGQRREIAPEQSIYNRLTDLQWRASPGETRYCGGDVLLRRTALESVGGFNESLIAGEEPDLCARLTQQGWRIWRLGCDMTRHDMAMTRLSQWWQRTVRVGHAFAEVADLHRHNPARHKQRELWRCLIWGAAGPVVLVTAGLLLTIAIVRETTLTDLPALAHVMTLALGLCAYCLLGLRIYLTRCSRGDGRIDGFVFTVFCVAGKVPEAIGALSYWTHRLRGKRRGLIEYK